MPSNRFLVDYQNGFYACQFIRKKKNMKKTPDCGCKFKLEYLDKLTSNYFHRSFGKVFLALGANLTMVQQLES